MAASDILYIKADQSAEVQKRDVTLGDILTLECSNKDVLSKVKTLKLLKVPDEGQHRYVSYSRISTSIGVGSTENFLPPK